MAYPFHVEFLTRELQARKKRNPRYSLRAFAHFLALDPAALSRILAGKQELSLRATQRTIVALKLSPEEQAKFIASVAESRKAKATAFLGGANPETSPSEINPTHQDFHASSAEPRHVTTQELRVNPERVHEACDLIRAFTQNLEKIWGAAPGASSIKLSIETSLSESPDSPDSPEDPSTPSESKDSSNAHHLF